LLFEDLNIRSNYQRKINNEIENLKKPQKKPQKNPKKPKKLRQPKHSNKIHEGKCSVGVTKLVK
jgi:hypothetical protein